MRPLETGKKVGRLFFVACGDNEVIQLRYHFVRPRHSLREMSSIDSNLPLPT
jgi:hypothetical protein